MSSLAENHVTANSKTTQRVLTLIIGRLMVIFLLLVLSAGLTWRQATVLRAYAKYMRQGGTPFAQDYIEEALKGNVDIMIALVMATGAAIGAWWRYPTTAIGFPVSATAKTRRSPLSAIFGSEPRLGESSALATAPDCPDAGEQSSPAS